MNINKQESPVHALKLGVVPMGKFVFSHEDALKQKDALFARLKDLDIRIITPGGVIPDGVVRDIKHVGPVVEHMRQSGVDALFLPHCNFGTEAAAGMIARELGLPTLLWGPRDGGPLEDGSRLRDSLCGLFASSKVLHKLGVAYAYIENCAVDDPVFARDLDTFLRAVATAKAVRTMRIGFIGARIDFFWTTIVNESELLEHFGIQVQPIDMVFFIRDARARLKANRRHYEAELDTCGSWFEISKDTEVREGLLNSLAMRDVIFEVADDLNLDGIALQSFFSLQEELGPGLGLGLGLAEEQIPIAAESDLHGAISSVLLRAASRSSDPVFMPEFTIRHPDNDNAVLLWHAQAPPSLRHPATGNVCIREPWILKGLPPTSLQFRLRDGALTVCRFDGDGGRYQLGFGEGHTTDGPFTREFYAWFEVDDWPRWERTLIEGPFIHHCSAAYDTCADVLRMACRFIPGLQPQPFQSGGAANKTMG